MNFYIYTLGCRVNQCESEAIANSFAKSGWNILQDFRGSDLIVVNTCTVTSKAEQKARRVIRLFSKEVPVIVTGCYADSSLEKISQNIIVFPIFRKPELLHLADFIKENMNLDLCSCIKAFNLTKPDETCSVFDYAAADFSYHCRSFLKIQDGCDNNCAYCRTHVARGKSSFSDSDTVVKRALEIEKAGYHEIVLTGVNLTMYDHDGNGLGGLLEKLLDKLGSDIRIRLSSMEPDHIDNRLIQTLRDRRMQPYFHIPIQSASEKVIRRVNRNYSISHLEKVVSEIRQIRPEALLACDVITGLPSEDEEDFEITKDFLVKNNFSLFHVFPFSPRPDTPLFKSKDRVSESIRDKRAEILRNLSKEQYNKYVKLQIGKPNEVILEECKNKIWYGLTGNYIRVRVDNVPDSAHCGDLKQVLLKNSDCALCFQ